MKVSTGSLVALTLGCAFAAALSGFGAEVFAFRSAYEGMIGRQQLILITRLGVYLILTLILVFRGGWRGVMAAVAMALGATAIEWALFPFAYEWAALENPSGYREEFGGVSRPSYGQWAVYDVLIVAVSAILSQGLRLMAHVDPRSPRDE